MSLLSEFKKFLLRGNVVDLAVAVVVGTAFTAVVRALVADLMTPISSLIFGKGSSAASPSRSITATSPLNNLFTCLTVAAAMFFVVVALTNHLMNRRAQEDPDEK
ncbi:MAG: MscL family protein [Solirubrobacteraceae bacterium]